VLWYLVAVASRANINIADVATNVDRDHASWQQKHDEPLKFSELQDESKNVRSEPTPAFERTLMVLASRVGNFVNDIESGSCENNTHAIAGHLVNIFRSLIAASNESGVTLEVAANKNLEKIFGRWPKKKTYPKLFDSASPEYERFPHYLEIDIMEKQVEGKTFVIQRCNNITIGDRLTDNIQVPDDYRFHDVFHYANTAVLGWSPVTRALFKLKRKSQPKIDEAEDGARAILLEEGITAWIFNQSKPLDHFAGISEGDLSFGLLKTIRKFVDGYEVEQCPLWLWEQAILQGYAAFRYLKENRRGRVAINLKTRTMSVGPIPPT
jgi:hypothetical protein